jgi:hypothetical protein
VILISNDGDFEGDSPNQLHDHLREDLTSEGLAPDRVQLTPSLDDYLKRHVDSSTQALELARHRLEANPDWAAELGEAVQQALLSVDISRDRVTIVASPNASPDFQYVDEAAIEGLEISDAYETGDDDAISLEVVVNAKMQFTFTTTRTEAEWLAVERTDVDFDLFEETFAQGHTGDRYVTVRFALDFNVESNELGEPEKLDAEDTEKPQTAS